MKKEELNIKPVEKEVSQEDLKEVNGGIRCRKIIKDEDYATETG